MHLGSFIIERVIEVIENFLELCRHFKCLIENLRIERVAERHIVDAHLVCHILQQIESECVAVGIGCFAEISHTIFHHIANKLTLVGLKNGSMLVGSGRGGLLNG